jgi:high-affinity K+ transport system ATPase subunit B
VSSCWPRYRRRYESNGRITGDNKLTAAKIAEESGVDDFLAEATPENLVGLSALRS